MADPQLRVIALAVESAPREIERKLEELPLPMEVKRLLQWHWPRKSIALGPYTLHTAEDIVSHDDLDRLLTASMVPVGYAPNGDILAIRFEGEREELGLVRHDDLWEGEATAADAYVPVCRGVDEYLWRVAEGRYLPRDSHSAEEWQELLHEQRSRSGA